VYENELFKFISFFTFPCKVIYPTGDPTVAFHVMWNVDGNALLDPATSKPVVNTLTGDQRVAYLDSKYLMGHLGKNVSEKRYESFTLFRYISAGMVLQVTDRRWL
jgi:hypothetical protein